MDEVFPALMTSIALGLLSFLLLGLLIWFLRTVSRKMRENQEREDQAAFLFERSTMNHMEATRAPMAQCAPGATRVPAATRAAGQPMSVMPPVGPATSASPAGPAGPAGPVGPVGPVSPMGPAAPPAPTLSSLTGPQAVLRRLEGLGQIGGVDGSVAVSGGQNQGVAFHFKNGKRGLVLPAPEPPEALAKYLRAYEYVFTILPGDETAVTQRMADFVTQLIDPGKF